MCKMESIKFNFNLKDLLNYKPFKFFQYKKLYGTVMEASELTSKRNNSLVKIS